MTKMIKTAAIAALLSCAAASPVFAQATGGVLTVDLDKLYTDSLAGKNGQQQLTGRYQAPNQQLLSAAQTAQTAYDSQLDAARKVVGPNGDASKLTPAARQSLGEAQDRLQEAQGNLMRLRQAVQETAAYVRDQINQAALPLIEQVRVAHHASVVLPRNVMLAFDPSTDVTAEVLPRLDAALKTVSIDPPQAQNQAAPSVAAPAASGPQRPAPRGR